ncbi:PQ-loop repeat-containing protein 3 [Lonchura striata]|uniref:PQ-loop repeat-containing protein 3 n=1 Tax=Lonchura striata TaxID=40157 RepID=A0A218VBK0_9PASE|nr:PQ-loop repeat-containing protein 3 [Lonchura striata domestica]
MAPGLLDLVHLTTWAVCAVIKLPQVVAVLRAGSTWGLSVSSLLLELAGLLVFLRYQIYYGYPLETYLEYLIVIGQGNFCKPCFGNEMGLVQPSKPLHVARIITTVMTTNDLAACLYTSKSLQTSAVTVVDFFDLCLQYFFSLLVLIRFIVMLILNIWVTATILHYRKTKKTD